MQPADAGCIGACAVVDVVFGIVGGLLIFLVATFVIACNIQQYRRYRKERSVGESYSNWSYENVGDAWAASMWGVPTLPRDRRQGRE